MARSKGLVIKVQKPDVPEETSWFLPYKVTWTADMGNVRALALLVVDCAAATT